MLIERALRRTCRCLPERAQYLLGDAYAHTLRPFRHGGKGFRAYWTGLCETEHWTRAELEKLQWEKFKRLLDHAWQNVKFYRRRFEEAGIRPEDIRSREDLSRIPVVTKADVRGHGEDFLAEGVRTESLFRKQTSGSTGDSLVLYSDYACYVSLRAAVARWRKMAGCDPIADRCMYVGRYGFAGETEGKPPYTSYDPADQIVYMPATSLRPEGLAECVQRFRSFRPVFIQGACSAIYLLACYVRDKGHTGIRLRAALTADDMLLPKYRDVIEAVFGCKVFNTYGMAERTASAEECEEHNGLHIDMEQCLVEIVDESGTSVVGRSGYIVGTNLGNYAMPLIRYRTGDVGEVGLRRCPCGRESHLIEKLEGREGGFVRTPEGLRIGPSHVAHTLRMSPKLRECQVIQKTEDSLQVLAVWEAGAASGDVAELEKELRNTFGSSIRIEIKAVDSIPKTAQGKFRLVVSETGTNPARA